MPHKVHKIVLFVNTFCVTSDGIGDWLILEKIWLKIYVSIPVFHWERKKTKH